MIEIEIKADTSRFDRTMADFPAAMDAARFRARRDIGQAVASRATLAFRTSSLRPSPWAPRKDQKSTHPLLIRSGALRQSITWQLRGTDAVVVGTDRKYAGYHQRGTKNMPARPFFPMDKNGNLVPEMERKIRRVIERDFREELERLGG